MSNPIQSIAILIHGRFDHCNWDSLSDLVEEGVSLFWISTDEQIPDIPDIVSNHWLVTEENTSISLFQAAIEKCDREWLFLLHEAEIISHDQIIDALSNVDEGSNYLEATIKSSLSNQSLTSHRFEIRGIRNNETALDQLNIIGQTWTSFSLNRNNEDLIYREALRIQRTSPFTQQVNWTNFDEINVAEFDNHDLLWLGYLALDRQNTELARKAFNTISFSDLDAYRYQPSWYNGMAQLTFLEEKWEDTKAYLAKSLDLVEQQQLPHVIRFNIASKRMQWEDAYQHLYSYLQNLAEGSRVNHDVIIPLAQTHQLLAETAYQGGQPERAFAHYQELYRLQSEQDEEIDHTTLERLLLYSIELGEKEEAISYFHHLYDPILDHTLTDDQWNEIDRRVQLFAGKEWYDFVVERYQQLFKVNPKRPAALRRLVAALIKNGEIERAQALIRKHKTVIS